LSASKITSGTFADARLASSNVTQHVDLTALSASNLTSGTVPSARLSLSASDVPDLATSKITSGTFADARLSSSSVTQHVDLSNLSASNLTSGSIPNARVPSGAVTQHVSAVTNTTGTWTPNPSDGSLSILDARYQRVGDLCYAIMWAKASNSSSITYDNTIFTMSGLPITARNTGDSADCVGWGNFVSRGSAANVILAIVMSNSSTMSFVRVNQSFYAPNSTNTSVGGTNPSNADFKVTRYNMYNLMQNQNESHMCIQITYLV
jgi:hypothetical protein